MSLINFNTVNFISDLATYQVVGLASGETLVFVRETGRLYRLDANSGNPADGQTIISAPDGREWFIT